MNTLSLRRIWLASIPAALALGATALRAQSPDPRRPPPHAPG